MDRTEDSGGGGIGFGGEIAEKGGRYPFLKKGDATLSCVSGSRMTI
jgi:hypothetical protein